MEMKYYIGRKTNNRSILMDALRQGYLLERDLAGNNGIYQVRRDSNLGLVARKFRGRIWSSWSPIHETFKQASRFDWTIKEYGGEPVNDVPSLIEEPIVEENTTEQEMNEMKIDEPAQVEEQIVEQTGEQDEDRLTGADLITHLLNGKIAEQNGDLFRMVDGVVECRKPGEDWKPNEGLPLTTLFRHTMHRAPYTLTTEEICSMETIPNESTFRCNTDPDLKFLMGEDCIWVYGRNGHVRLSMAFLQGKALWREE